MKFMVEFASKAEMDEFMAASEAGTITAPASVYLVNKTGQTVGLTFSSKDDEEGAGIIELHQRGTPGTTTLVPDIELKIV